MRETGRPTALVNAISVRTGGAATFLRNIVPHVSQILRQWKFFLVVRQGWSGLTNTLGENTQPLFIPERALASPVRRLLFDHVRIPLLQRLMDIQLHWQVDEMLSPIVSSGKTPSVITFHTTPTVLVDGSTGDNRLSLLYGRSIRRIAARWATIPVTVSQYAKAELATLYPWAGGRFRVVYHGVDQDKFYPKEADRDYLRRVGIGRPYLLSVSNRFVWKNYFRLIQAYEILVSSYGIEEDLVLVGKGKVRAEERRIAELIRAGGLCDRVHLIGYMDQWDLSKLYQGAAAYVFPSFRETLGVTILEAMASGLPVICSGSGPLPEIAADAAYYFDPTRVDEMADAILAVLRNVALRRELCERGVKRAGYFTWERAAGEYRRLMLEAIGG